MIILTISLKKMEFDSYPIPNTKVFRDRVLAHHGYTQHFLQRKYRMMATITHKFIITDYPIRFPVLDLNIPHPCLSEFLVSTFGGMGGYEQQSRRA